MTTAQRHRFEDAAAAAGYAICRLKNKRERKVVAGWLCAVLLITLFVVVGLAYVLDRNEEANRSAATRAAEHQRDRPAVPLNSFQTTGRPFTGGAL